MLPLIATLLIGAGSTHAGIKSLSVSLKTKTLETPALLAVAPAPYGSKFLASFEDNTVRVMDARTGKTLLVFRKHPQPAYAVAWSSDGTFVASGDESARIFVWNSYTGQVVKTFRTHIRGIQNLSFNRQHNLLLSTGKDDVCKVYDLQKGKEIKSIPSGGLNFYGGQFNPGTNTFAVGTLSVGARIYRTDGMPIRFLTGHGGQGVLDIDYSPNGKQIVTGGKDGTAILWDVKTSKKTGTLTTHDDWVVHTAFAPDSRIVATSSDTRTVRLWDSKTLKQVAELDDESSVGAPIRFTADGKYLISANVSDQLQITALTPNLVGQTHPAPKASRSAHRRRHHRR